MNKFIFISFVIFAVVNSVVCDSSEEVLENVKSKHIKKLLQSKHDQLDSGLEQLEEKCPGVKDKIKNALKAFQECDDKVDESLTICAAIKNYALNCTKPLLQVVEDCLPTKAKGLPTLGAKSLVSLADHLCKQTGEQIFELANPCLWEDVEEPSEQLNQCEEKVKTFASKFQNENVPTQAEICGSLTDFRGCVQLHTTAACKNEKTRNALLGVYDALVAPCTKSNEV